MNKKEIIKYCTTLPSTFEDYPFPDDNITVDYIIPAYHMNKEHWNTIVVSRNADETIIKELIEQSYELTKK